MSDGKRETVEDIVEEMRDATMNGEFDDATVNEWADRIEAAWRRDEERAVEHATRHSEAVARDNCRDCIHNPNGKNYEPVTDSHAIGNAAAMREALEYMLDFDATDDAAMDDGLTDAERIMEYADHIAECQKKARAALSAPPRQCDVGTAEDQCERWMAFCGRYDDDCTGCPCDDANCASYTKCFARWAQTPYEAEEGAGK